MQNFGGSRSLEYTETITTGANGESLYLHPINSPTSLITLTLVAAANTGKFQTTTSPYSAIVTGTATWKDWAYGDSTGTAIDVVAGPITGVRGVSVSGTIVIEVVI